MKQKKEGFGSKIGFVLAAAGSAVGLGNIWRFPYLAAKYGGGIFLLVYIILALTFGFALMCAEIAIGRKTGVSAIEAFSKLNKKFKFVGLLCSIVPIIILPYYSVIGGWIIKYCTVFITGNISSAATDGFFDSFISAPTEPLLWFAIYIGLTALVVLLGVEKGIEKVSKIMMPVLVTLLMRFQCTVRIWDGCCLSCMRSFTARLKPFMNGTWKNWLSAWNCFWNCTRALSALMRNAGKVRLARNCGRSFSG